jgi:ABC-type amino acid transport system permease subunit
VLDILYKYHEGFLNGLIVTLKLVSLIWSIGILGGFLVGLLGIKWKRCIGLPAQTISFILSGVPILVFLFWLHYPAQSMLEVVIDPFYTTVFALSVVNIFSIAEIVRNTSIQFPSQYMDVAKVCGIPPFQRFYLIELPLVMRHILPSLLNSQVNMLHMTLFASLISVDEIFRAAQRINAQIYQPVEIYSLLGLFFLAVSLPINGIAIYLKKKYGRDLSEK